MKKLIFGLTLITLLFSLGACTAKPAETTTDTGTTIGLSTEAEMIVGTLKLEGTANAITADQAKTLLPLWQTYQSLSSSSTSATEELTALVDQIKNSMTSPQLDAIIAMDLTPETMMTAMNDLGLGFNRSALNGTQVAPGQNDGEFFVFEGEPPADGGGFTVSRGAGGPPSDAGPGGAGGPPSGGFVIQGDFAGPMGGPPGDSSSPQAVRDNGFANRVPPPLLNALIELLKKKTQ